MEVNDMKYVDDDSYLCPNCGCIFSREELGDNAPDFTNAIIERNNIQCISCGHIGMNYQVKELNGVHMMFRTTRR